MEEAASLGDIRTVNILGRRIARDSLVARVFYLLFFASFGSLFPLLAIYFKQLGMSAYQAGVLLGVRPLVELASGPFWRSFAARFRKGKLLVLFSMGALIVFTLFIGFVQPITPYCVAVRQRVDEGADGRPRVEGLVEASNSSCQLELVPAGKYIRGGALGMVKAAAGLGRMRRAATGSAGRKGKTKTTTTKAAPPTLATTTRAPHIMEKIIDLSQFEDEDERTIGMAPEWLTKDKVCNYRPEEMGVLVSPPHSTRVYRQPGVEQAFMLLLILVAVGEFCSAPALSLVDAAVYHSVSDNPRQFGRIRLFGSVGWAAAMFLLGLALDYSDTFRNHPCPTANTTEKNYALCFIMCSVFMLGAMLVVTQLRFAESEPDVAGLVMDSRADELGQAAAEKARARQVQAQPKPEANRLWAAARALLLHLHISLYLLSTLTISIGIGVSFTFLYWHLQDIGGSPFLFGILSIMNHAAEIAAFFYAFKIINRWGHVRVMYGCLCANAVRFLLLAVVDNPWLVIPLQTAQGATTSLAWTAASSYVSLVVPAHIKPESQRLLTLLYQSVGRAVGAFGGGAIIALVGSRLLFVYYAALCALVFGVSFALNRHFHYAGIKYGQNAFDEDDLEIMGPQGVPTATNEQLADAFAPHSALNSHAANYGATDSGSSAARTTTSPPSDPTQDAYDRYVAELR